MAKMRYGVAYGDKEVWPGDRFATKAEADAALPSFIASGEETLKGFNTTWEEWYGGKPHVVKL